MEQMLQDEVLTRNKICNWDFVTVSFLRRDGSSEKLLDPGSRDHNVSVERQLLVPLPDRYDNLGERPTQRGPPDAGERAVRACWVMVLHIILDVEDREDGKAEQIVDNHVRRGVEDHGNVRILNH